MKVLLNTESMVRFRIRREYNRFQYRMLKKKKEEIIALAQAMGYMPNLAALHLRHSKSRIIGLYFSSISAATSPYVLHSVL